MDAILNEIIKELKSNVDISYQKNFQRFFLEPVFGWGVPKKKVREIGKKYFENVTQVCKSKNALFLQCERLLQRNRLELTVIALQWVHMFKKYYEPEDITIFEHWLRIYITNWSTCDDFCAGVLGGFFMMYPDLMGLSDQWSRDHNRWVRRASAVVLIYCAREPHYSQIILKRALALLHDRDLYVQKGYGWLLKKTSEFAPAEIFDFVMDHKSEMPRLALRYAIEKFPKNLKQRAMRKH